MEWKISEKKNERLYCVRLQVRIYFASEWPETK